MVQIVEVIGGLAILVSLLASMWTIFSKAGESGWESLIPIINLIVLCRICRISPFWVFALMLPMVGNIVLALYLPRAFGKDTLGFTVGMIFLPIVFLPILAFGDAQYEGAGGRRSQRSVRRFADEDDYDDNDRPRRR